MARFSRIVLISAVMLAGCDGGSPQEPPFNAGPLMAMIAIVDQDDATFVPELPDDFAKPGPGAGKPPGDAPALEAIPETQALPPPVDPSMSFEAGPNVDRPKVEAREVYYYPAPFDCPGCRRHEREAPAMNDFRFVKAAPDAWAKRQKQGYPHFRWQIKDRWVGEAHGWTSPEDFRATYKKSFEAKPLPVAASHAPQPQRGVVRSTGHWWSIDELRRHLAGEHGYSAAQVAGMSDADCVAAHSAAHSSAAAITNRRPKRRERKHA